VVHPERQMGQRVAQMLHNPLVRDYVSMGNGYYAISVVVPESMAGHRVSDLKFGEDFNLRCLNVMRGSHWLSDEESDPELQVDDSMLVLGKRADLRTFSDKF
jgi:trk system potassium uptake protein TrkA